jgi:hypothetical protein
LSKRSPSVKYFGHSAGQSGLNISRPRSPVDRAPAVVSLLLFLQDWKALLLSVIDVAVSSY